jgi:4'-phosphopantetheinyl transferase
MFPSPDPRIYCLLQPAAAQRGLAEGLPPDGLLSADEHRRYSRFLVPKRRRDWLLGRWTAKHLVQSYLALAEGLFIALDQIEILSDDDGAPYAFVGEGLPLSLSISHSGDQSFCALCRRDVGFVGADIEQLEPRDIAFVRTFFTGGENAAVDAAAPAGRDAFITALWSAKEAALKTLRLGLRADTRQVEVLTAELASAWRPITARLGPVLVPSPSASLSAWQMSRPGYVLSLALLLAA